MQRPSYRHAIAWLAANDDCSWIEDEFGTNSVTSSLVADLFGVTDERVKVDLIREIKRQKEQSA